MNKIYGYLAVLFLMLCPGAGFAQNELDELGFELGIFRIKPEVRAAGAYNDRVVINGSEAEGDLYGEAEAYLDVENTDARYDVGAWASYGHRSYDDFSVLDDNFYGAGGEIASREDALKFGLSGYLKKTLDYDVRSNDSSGSGLGAILSPNTSKRTSVIADVGYELQLTEKSAIMPGYEGRYYYQDFAQQEDAEWQEHEASLTLGYGIASRTVLTLSGNYNTQITDEETGSIASLLLGAKSRATEKIDWTASLGIAAADYEITGTDQSWVGSVRARWQATEKISAYVFGRSNYRPGYSGGGARQVYRAGYGANWRVVDRLRLDVQMLHDYDESIQSGTGASGSNTVRHFFTGRVDYDLTRHILLGLSGQYINDEEEMDQMIVSLQAALRY